MTLKARRKSGLLSAQGKKGSTAMGLFDRIGAALSGQSGNLEAVTNAERMLSTVAGAISDGQKTALATVAKDLSRRFDYEIDITDIPNTNPVFPQVVAARADLLTAANQLSSKQSMLPTANQLQHDMAFASLIFYHFIVMRGVSAGSGEVSLRAQRVADSYSAFLKRVFPA